MKKSGKRPVTQKPAHLSLLTPLFDTSVASRLTRSANARSFISSPVAIGRHSSTTAYGHVERLRAARPSGNSEKHP